MARDGTNRGGARPGAGRPKKALSEKIAAGNPGGRALTQIKVPDDISDLVGEDMPKPSEILSAKQKNGKPLGADKIYEDTWLWLKGFKCERLVSPAMIEQYAMSVARWMQCEEAISSYGLLGKHPTCPTSPIQSPFVAMSQSFMKRTAYPFTGKLICNCCGKHYQRRKNTKGYSWICSTFNREGKSACPSRQIPEITLEKLTAEALGLPEFNAEIFGEQIEKMDICNDCVVKFHFADGHEETKHWQVRSRSESWTAEMREKARRKSCRE